MGHHWPNSETSSKWRFAVGLVLANIRYWLGSFVSFQGGPDTLFSPLDLRMGYLSFILFVIFSLSDNVLKYFSGNAPQSILKFSYNVA